MTTHAPHGRHTSYNLPRTNHDHAAHAHLRHPRGQSHEGIDFSFAADSPDPYANLSPDERDTRAILTTDHCIMDQKTFFLCGCLEIPIIGHSEPFLWGLWAIVWEKDFDEIDDCWESPGREKTHGPFKGRLLHLGFWPTTND